MKRRPAEALGRATERVVIGSASARAALAGNPSDGYGGAVLAVTLQTLGAEATAAPAPVPAVEPPSALVAATVERFARELVPPARSTAVRWHTEIPRGVGLGGSSAIVIATLRALCTLHEVSLPPATLASFALSVETHELGIAAGLQDRVAQAHGGLTFMEFADQPRYERLDSALLPPLLIAWLGEAAQDSRVVHGALRSRFERGAPGVAETMRDLAEQARAARTALLTGDRAAFAEAVDTSFDLRSRALALEPSHVELVARARALGASVNYTGSGGAIVAVCRDGRHVQELASALSAVGCGTLSVG